MSGFSKGALRDSPFRISIGYNAAHIGSTWLLHGQPLKIFLLQLLKFNETYPDAHIICIAVVENYYRSAGKNSFHIAMAYEASYWDFE